MQAAGGLQCNMLLCPEWMTLKQCAEGRSSAKSMGPMLWSVSACLAAAPLRRHSASKYRSLQFSAAWLMHLAASQCKAAAEALSGTASPCNAAEPIPSTTTGHTHKQRAIDMSRNQSKSIALSKRAHRHKMCKGGSYRVIRQAVQHHTLAQGRVLHGGHGHAQAKAIQQLRP